METKKTQCELIVDYMEKNGCITAYDAIYELGITRLASRISDLRKIGYDINAKTIFVENKYHKKVAVKEYSLNG